MIEFYHTSTLGWRRLSRRRAQRNAAAASSFARMDAAASCALVTCRWTPPKAMPMIEAIKRGACHLWYWQSPDPLRIQADEARLQARLALLDPTEAVRYRRYLVAEAASTFLASRELLRSALSLYWNVKPAAWRFEVNQWGRPRIANAGVPEELHFNLSHKPGFVVCLIGYGRELGVDVENISISRPHLLNLASRFFSRVESEDLRETPEERRLDRFYEFWTLKESYIKARGRGLSLGLSRFSFSVAGNSAGVKFDEGFDDQPDRWDFRLFRYNSHLMASTIELDPARPLAVEVRSASELICRTLNLSEQ